MVELKSELSHKHIWKIEPATGPTSMGICDCGEEKEFRNYLKECSGVDSWVDTQSRPPKNFFL